MLRKIREATVHLIFDHYDRLLAILDDPSRRSALEAAQNPESLRDSPVWSEVQAVSRPFHDGLVSLFLRDDPALTELTMQYGLF